MSLVSFVEIQNKEKTEEAILRSLDLIQYDYPLKIRNVVIKPNLCYYWDYTTGQTTDPNFVAAIINLLREQISSNLSISIVESDASAMKCKYAFKMLGYERLAQNYDVNLVNLSEEKAEEENISINNQTFNFKVPLIIKNADLRINVPKIKYSLPQIKITCALKNIYGCNPYPLKYKYHKNLDEVIVAINKLMKFNLCILDGIIVSGVQPKKLGLIMSSLDPVAFDAAASKIAGVNQKSVKHLLLAQKEGIGNISYTPRGMSLEYFREKYPRKGFKNMIMQTGYNLVYTFGLEKRLGLE
jgi:uncharacterized protein (DUF362 family)